MLLDGSTVNIGIAFLGGMVAFFAPCVLPLVPAYVGYFAGVGIDHDDEATRRSTIMKNAGVFVIGFLLVFVLLGLSATSLGRLLAVHRVLFQRIGGAALVILGLYILQVFKMPWLYRQLKIDIDKQLTKSMTANSFLLGLTFGFAWTPCIGPLLAVILFWASQAESTFQGTMLLLAFGLGIAVPFFLLSVFIDRLMPFLRKSGNLQQWIHWVSGVLVLVFGVGLLFDLLAPVAGFFLQYSQGV